MPPSQEEHACYGKKLDTIILRKQSILEFWLLVNDLDMPNVLL